MTCHTPYLRSACDSLAAVDIAEQIHDVDDLAYARYTKS